MLSNSEQPLLVSCGSTIVNIQQRQPPAGCRWREYCLFSSLFPNVIHVGWVCWPGESMGMNRERLHILTWVFKKVFSSSGSGFPIVIHWCWVVGFSLFSFKTGFISVNVVYFSKGQLTFWKVFCVWGSWNIFSSPCICPQRVLLGPFTWATASAGTLPAGALPSPGRGRRFLLWESSSLGSKHFLPFYLSL